MLGIIPKFAGIAAEEAERCRLTSRNYSATAPPCLTMIGLVPGGEALWAAHRSASVIGTGMQNLPPQVDHGELVEVSVTGAQEEDVAAAVISPLLTLEVLVLLIVVARHGAGATVGAGTASPPPITASLVAVSPGPVGAPVSYTNVLLSDTRRKVNFGHTFSDESNVPPAFIVIEPVEVL
jgi:hypothetical protein